MFSGQPLCIYKSGNDVIQHMGMLEWGYGLDVVCGWVGVGWWVWVGGCGRVDELVWMYVWMWMGVVCVIASKPVATCVALFTRLNSFHCVNDDVTPSLAISCHTPP